ncbi:MAG: hypothetical protein R3E79_52070 [Caldilineaceae bacterium]
MRRMPIQAAEYSVIKTYLDLCWSVCPGGAVDNLDIQHAHTVLDEDHFGSEEIKDRILEFLAVRKAAHRTAAKSRATRMCATKSGVNGKVWFSVLLARPASVDGLGISIAGRWDASLCE